MPSLSSSPSGSSRTHEGTDMSAVSTIGFEVVQVKYAERALGGPAADVATALG